VPACKKATRLLFADLVCFRVNAPLKSLYKVSASQVFEAVCFAQMTTGAPGWAGAWPVRGCPPKLVCMLDTVLYEHSPAQRVVERELLSWLAQCCMKCML